MKKDTGGTGSGMQALRESEANLSAVLENVSDIILSVDREYRLLTINTAGKERFQAILNLVPREGQNVLELIPPELKSSWRARYDRALAGERFTLEDPYEGEDGTFYSEVSFNPIRLGTRITGVSVFSRDITARKRVEEKLHLYREELEDRVEERTMELQAVNRELEAFAYSISHDLRAPLRSIDGFIRVLLEDYVEQMDEAGLRLGQTIQDNARNMSQLIDDLLGFSRMGRLEMSFAAVQMQPLVEDVFQELTTPAERERISFSIAPLPRARGDHAMIRQVWRNLIANAIKFSRGSAPPEIQVSAERKEDRIIYSVRDNGIGFDMQHVDRIFVVFQRLHNEREFQGTGVGLALVKRIVERHGGEVSARGSKGAGARFSFSLPADEATPA